MSLQKVVASQNLFDQKNKQNIQFPQIQYETQQQRQILELLKKVSLDNYAQNLTIDQLRKLSTTESLTDSKITSSLNSSSHSFNFNQSSLPKQLLRKLQKLQANFLKEDDLNKDKNRSNKILAQKLKSEKQQEKKLSQMISRLQLQMNYKNSKNGQNQIEIPKVLHSKLIHMYNKYISQNRVNQIKRQQMEASQTQILKEEQEIQQLKYRLENKKKQYQQIKLQKLLKQEQVKNLIEKNNLSSVK